MFVNIHLKNIHPSESINNQVRQWAESYFKIRDGKKLNISIFIEKRLSKNNFSMREFECHMIATAPWLHSKIFAKNRNSDFWKCYTMCSKKIAHQIQKDTQKSKFRKSQHTRDELRDEWKHINTEIF